MNGAARLSNQNQALVAKDRELVGIYNALFDVTSTLTAEERTAAYRLRYEVYVEETGFLPAEENPGGLERDRFDPRSGQSLMIHRLTGEAIGTVRVIPPISDMPGCDLPARIAAQSLDTLPENMLPRGSTGEISRFSIAKHFRRRQSDALYPGVYDIGAATEDPRRVIPHIALGLMTGIFDQVLKFDLTHLCAIIDPALLRLLRRLGIEFHPIGGPVEFHGMRQPVIARCSDLVEQLASNRPEIYQVVSRSEHLHLPG